MQLQCFATVHTTFSIVYLPCNFGEPLYLFLVLNSSYRTRRHCSYSSYIFFFFSSLPFVLIYIYCYTDTTNFIIFSQLLTCQFLTSRNKIITYEAIANHNWKEMFKKNVTTIIVITIFSQLLKSQFLIYQIIIKMLNSQHFNINFTINHR